MIGKEFSVAVWRTSFNVYLFSIVIKKDGKVVVNTLVFICLLEIFLSILGFFFL